MVCLAQGWAYKANPSVFSLTVYMCSYHCYPNVGTIYSKPSNLTLTTLNVLFVHPSLSQGRGLWSRGRTWWEVLTRPFAMSKRRLFLALVVLMALYIVLFYSFDPFSLYLKFVAVQGDEKTCDGLNGSCAISFTAKSWNTCMLTRYWPEVSARCDLLWNGDSKEVKRVKRRLGLWRNSVSDKQFLKKLRNCTYVQDLLNDNFYTSQVEIEFPIAFLFVIHQNPQQTVRLLRVLYRPQNAYCIHIDAKAKPDVIEAFRSMTQCVPNVLVPRKLISVYWGLGESLLEAQMSCLEALRSARESWKWKYAINLAGTELPMVTNRDMVERLIALNGTMFIFTDNFPESMRKYRFSKKYLPDPNTGKRRESKETFGEPPYGMEIYKASTFCIMSFAFVDFLFTHPKANALRKYLEGAICAEEHFFISLYHLPEAPVGNAPFHQHSVYQMWTFTKESQQRCNGPMQHDMCIVGVGTMKSIRSMGVFFVNKYSENKDHVIMDCTERRIVEKNKMEYSKDCSKAVVIPKKEVLAAKQ